MSVVYPYMAWAFMIIPMFIIAYIFRAKDRLRIWQVFQTPARWSDTITMARSNGFFWRKTMVILALTFIIIASMRPQYGEQYQTVKREGRHIIFAVDVSLSMLAEDERPNRLAAAKYHILQLLPSVSSDFISVVPFSGSAFTYLPMTTDQSAARIFIQDIAIGMIGSSGTDLGGLIQLVTSMKERIDQWKDPIIIVFTDGEFKPMIDESFISKHKRSLGNSPIFVGLGGDKPEPIPLRGDANQILDYKRDASSQIVLSKQERTILGSLAKEWNGLYIDAHSTQLVADSIYQYLQAKETQLLEEKQTVTKVDRYHGLLILALLLLLIDMFYPNVQQWLRQRHKGVLILILAMSSNVFASHPGVDAYNNQAYDEAEIIFMDALNDRPDDAKVRYNLANTYVKKGDPSKAISLYEEALSGLSNEDQISALYNIATAQLANNQTAEAIETYKQVLQLDPSHQKAKENLEFTLLQPKQPNSSSGSNQKNQSETADEQTERSDQRDESSDGEDQADESSASNRLGDEQSPTENGNEELGAPKDDTESLSDQQIQQLVNQAEASARKKQEKKLNDYFYKEGW